eukprot:GHVT01087224.1.p1 GENE.GHVT01087224.1~~GHVT01087224.1.p1  ORF type:complete len:212 (-),score=56.60 GHVT01087224.1:553-1188(-)
MDVETSKKKKCLRHGCHELYEEEDNGPDACQFHPGWPVFHDCSKKWTCCAQESWDWDGFMQIKGCERGCHSTVPPTRAGPPVPAAQPPSAAAAPAVIQSIESFNAQQQLKKSGAVDSPGVEAPLVTATKKEIPFRAPGGGLKCCHRGCHQEFKEEENAEDACHFHPGAPVFRDLKKTWTCCGVSSYDWDEFVKIKPCAKGPHAPRMVASPE